jgi:transcription termination factor Rho
LSAVASDDVREFATTILRDPLAFEVRGPEGEGEGGAMPRQPRHGQGRPPRQQSRRRDDGNRDQGNRDQGNRDQGNRDQGYREQGNRDDAPRDNQGEQERRSRDRDRQPISHESSLFPSSGPVFGYGDNRSGRRPRGGSGRRGGNY